MEAKIYLFRYLPNIASAASDVAEFGLQQVRFIFGHVMGYLKAFSWSLNVIWDKSTDIKLLQILRQKNPKSSCWNGKYRWDNRWTVLLCRLEELSSMPLNGSQWLLNVTSATIQTFARKRLFLQITSIYSRYGFNIWQSQIYSWNGFNRCIGFSMSQFQTSQLWLEADCVFNHHYQCHHRHRHDHHHPDQYKTCSAWSEKVIKDNE